MPVIGYLGSQSAAVDYKIVTAPFLQGLKAGRAGTIMATDVDHNVHTIRDPSRVSIVHAAAH